MAFGSISVDKITDSEGSVFSPSSALFRNRIINGDMRIDQRNAGAAVTINAATRTYGIDRWFGFGQATDGVFTIQQDTNAPTGFVNSTKITTTTADASVGASQYYLFGQSIEGFNIADLGWGTANAKTVTLSFWVYSSLTGTFGGSLTNNGNNRSYPFSYTISSANTYEQKTITIAGDTSGTWLTTNARGIDVWFDLGCGSSNIGTAGAWVGSGLYGVTGSVKLISTLNATWYITGVQLEVGSVATPFERRPYGTELALCQRYYEKSYNIETVPGANDGTGSHRHGGGAMDNDMFTTVKFAVTKRVTPTMTAYTTDGTSGSWKYRRSGVSATNSTVTFAGTGQQGTVPYLNVGTSYVVADMYGHWVASAEL